ncbi:hypothetical protein JessAGP_036c [Caulobacter phage Jess A]|nr:hypothetical protein JessAGP_036c [Caulobacter phage Jess A]QNH91688.1 hypothetical protein SR18_gp037c [Caulobacter phage SR18]WCA46445.1 hypothetical protein [Caulobacter phage RapA]
MPESTQRFWFGVVILGGFILAHGTLAFIPVPKENQQLFGQALGALTLAVGSIVNAIWRQRQAAPGDQADRSPTVGDKP